MSGISGIFKVPNLSLKRKKSHELVTFNWNLVTNKQELGNGSFGTVYSADYGIEARKVVIKKMKGESSDTKRRFLKEAEILSGIKHANIPAFLGFSDNPYGLMMEYINFDFNPFGTQKTVSNLEDFYHFVDCEFHFEAFADVLLVCLKDTTAGLEYLHKNNIVHRDLKPSNILVSNLHYRNKDKPAFEELYSNCPIICKVTDFGLSRSLDAQTQSILESRTDKICRGTPVYMAPEIHTVRLTNASQDDLKMADIWSLGMVAYSMVNPNLSSPYRRECESLGTAFNSEIMKTFMQQQRLPDHHTKYEALRVTEWWQLDEIFHLCAQFDPNLRPTALEVFSRLTDGLDSSPIVKSLKVSQNTALEVADSELALQLLDAKESRPTSLEQPIPESDGTNACVFLAMGIGHEFLQKVKIPGNVSWDDLATLAEKVISNLPLQINDKRDPSKLYEPSEAKTLLQENGLLTNHYDLSEECVSANGVFSEKGRQELLNALLNYQQGNKYRAGLYTCSPYTFLVGIHNDSYFVVDTHPICEELGGNGNGVLVITDDRTSRSCTLLVQWILKRLRVSGLNGCEAQSFAWLMPFIEIQDTAVEQFNINETSRHDSSLEILRIVNCTESSQNKRKSETTLGDERMLKRHQGETIEQSSHRDYSDVERSSTLSDHLSDPGLISDDKSEEDMSHNSAETHRDVESTNSSKSSSDEQENAAQYLQSALYNDDALTPAFSWKNDAYTREELVRILLEDHETERLCISQPINIQHNVTFLINNAKMKNLDDIKCDDMGSWKRTGTPKSILNVYRNKDGSLKHIKHVTRTETSAAELDSKMYILKRTYYVNNSSDDLRKIISTLQDYRGNVLKYTLVQYLFQGKEHAVDVILPHGNAKQKRPYHRILASTRDALKRPSSNETPKQILDKVYSSVGDVTKARSIGELPRGPTDLYNARFSSNQKTLKNKEVEGVNGIWALLEKAKREEEISSDAIFIRECRVHPDFLAILATNRQLDDLKRFCTNPNDFCIFGVDPTFNIFEENISLTVTTYRNLKLHKTTTNTPPVFIGPLLMHQHKDWKTYARFGNFLTTECSELEGLLACGTDGEKALIDGLKRNFRYALFLRCFVHFKENLKRELKKRGLANNAIEDFITEIFGKQQGSIMYQGLVDRNSEEEFDVQLAGLKEKWDARETECGRSNKDGISFYEWFCKEKANDIKESMLKPLRTEAGLGDPPKEYLNNDPESANFIIKHSLKFDAKKPQEFILEVKNIIETQYRNEDRAVFGKGMYKVRKEFQHLVVDDLKWSKMTHAQKLAKLEAYQNTGMEGKKTYLDVPDDDTTRTSTSEITISDKHLSITAIECGITTIPMPILEAMFQKANRLLDSPENIIPKPAATDGSYIVPGHSNTIHIVTPGKGGSLKCDRSCVNVSTRICEHILAVAQTRGSLSEFFAWYTKSKRGPRLLDMALGSAPKSAGRKPSNRKRSNRQKSPVTEVRDLLDEEENGFSNTQAERISQNTAPTTTTSNVTSIPAPHPLRQIAPRHSQTVVQQISNAVRNINPTANTQATPITLNVTSIPTPHPLRQIAPRENHSQAVVQQISNAVRNSIPAANTQAEAVFRLKWVPGTRISRCYGCNKEIKNPPVSQPDDLVVVYRDIRQYRDRNTGTLQYTSEPQNVHFHLRASCIRAKYPSFKGEELSVAPDLHPHLKVQHIRRLVEEFNWVLQV